MNCPNCGTENNTNSKFCIKCGTNLSVSPQMNEQSNVQPNSQPDFSNNQTMSQTTNQPEMPLNNNPAMEPTPTVNTQAPINNSNNNTINPGNTNPTPNTMNTSNEPKEKTNVVQLLFSTLAMLLKPDTAFKEERNKLGDFKNSAIIAVLVSIITTIISTITSILSIVRRVDYGYLSGKKTVTWNWELLKEVEFIELIGKNLLIYIAIIFAIAGIYYIVSLIFKKQASFPRMLGISAVSVVPLFLSNLLLTPLLAMLNGTLAVIATIIGIVYFLVLMYELMNQEVALEGNSKFYYNTACLSILLGTAYFSFMKFMEKAMSSVSSLDNLLDMFG